MEVFLSLFCFAITAFATYWLTKWQGLLDSPNHRSLHTTPVPRTGGWAITSAFWLTIIAALFLHLLDLPLALSILPGTAFVNVLGAIDDWRDLGVKVRLIAHLTTATVCVILIHSFYPISLPLLILSPFAIVWMLNLFNFMDGMDGFAGSMAITGFGSIGLLAYLAGDPSMAFVCGMICAASAGFLPFNWHPAKIFMGDAGSTTLGFIAGSLILYAHAKGLFSYWVGILAFAPFIADATYTLAYRAYKKERLGDAHRKHLYQRLVRMGWGHKKTLYFEWALMALSSAAAFATFFSPVHAQALIALCLVGGFSIFYGYTLYHPGLQTD